MNKLIKVIQKYIKQIMNNEEKKIDFCIKICKL